MVVLWDTAGVPWVNGNDVSASKPCRNPRSSSDEDFTGSKTASFAAVFEYNLCVCMCVCSRAAFLHLSMFA